MENVFEEIGISIDEERSVVLLVALLSREWRLKKGTLSNLSQRVCDEATAADQNGSRHNSANNSEIGQGKIGIITGIGSRNLRELLANLACAKLLRQLG
jgi:hypothetical protein